jgi:valyl-tRNA synthetase
MSHLPKAYDPKLVEEKWTSFWETHQFFKANPHSGKKPYSIVIPPPNVTGVLHMGHALVNTLEDILIRWKRMQGFEALWVPGTDHAGIATQAVVERHLLTTTGKRRADFTREEFVAHVWEWKEKSEKRILHQIRKLGCSCDWSRLRFTMDPALSKAVRVCFKKMYEEGLIYRGDYLVNWDPVTQTALSDDEVEYEEQPSFLWYIQYPFSDGSGAVTVATTRPETLLGDTGVAVHPKDPRYLSAIGKKIRLPLTNREIPVIADPFVDPTFGTGAVKLTPAHDFNDFEAAARHHLPLLNILSPDGHLNEAAGPFMGLSVEKARIAVVASLREKGHLIKEEPYLLRVGRSYRSKAVVQPRISKQWFLKMSPFKEKLISAVREKRVTLIPPHWEQTYFHWIENLRDWCISRQIWWGHRIPIWYDTLHPDKPICHAGEDPPPEAKLNPARYIQDPDVLDTWFSSALWPFTVFGWPESTPDLHTFYPTSTLITGHDILFFWVARMILMGEYVMQKVPFKETFLHGLIYGKSYWRTDPKGGIAYVGAEEKKRYDLGEMPSSDVEGKWEKMSKSKGNVIDPIEMIDIYGTDALRMALTSSVTHARQIDLDLRKFEEFKNFANKMWNGARFVFLNLEGFSTEKLQEGLDPPLLSLEDKWILSVLNRTIRELNESLEKYTFDKAATRAYEFFWNDFCAIYLESVKPVLFGKTGSDAKKKNTQVLLVILLSNAIRLLHPFAPFITEEIFSLLKEQFPKLTKETSLDPYTADTAQALLSPACAIAPYPSVLREEDIDLQVEARFQGVNQLVHAVRHLRAEMQLPPQEKTELYIEGDNTGWIEEETSILLALTPTSQIHFIKTGATPFGATTLVASIKITIPIPELFRAKERSRLAKEIEKAEKLLINTCGKLDNVDFKAKAPRPVVEKLEEAKLQLEREIDLMREKMSSLS